MRTALVIAGGILAVVFFVAWLILPVKDEDKL